MAEEREGSGHEQRRAHSLCHSERHERSQGGRGATEGRRDREQDETRQEYHFTAEPVAERPGGEQQAGKDERVAVDHPLEPRDGRAELLLDTGERHVHDGCIEDHHEVAKADGHERPRPGSRHAPCSFPPWFRPIVSCGHFE